MSDPTPTPPAPAPIEWRHRAFVAVALTVAAAALYFGVKATETDGESSVSVNGRPDVVEHVIPRNGAEILRQTQIGIDLVSGYEGTLVVNGLEIPAAELRVVPEQNQVFFTPGEGATVEKLPPGVNCATAIVWKSSEGRGANDLSFQWCFDVT